MNDWSRASLGALLRIGCALCSLTAVAGEIRLPRAPFFHLDAEAERAKVAAGVSVSPKEGIPLKEWSDRSPQRLRFQVDQPAHSPRLHFGEGWSTVRFDGVDDALRMLSPLKSLSSANLWIAIAPHGNPGDFRGFLAANAPGQRDYVSGMNIDLGPGSSFRWESINVEGQGFSGAQNTPLPRVKFGNLKIVEVQLDGREGQVIVSVDGKELGRRPWSRSEIAIDEWTLGARYYTNGPGEQQVRGHLACDIAEVIVFDGVLTREQREGITAQLIEKHRRLAEILPSELKLEQDSDLLVKVPNPPAVQMLEGGFEVHRLPLELTNINNVLYRHDGALITLGYNGDIHVLRDLDGDGLEDTAQIFFKNQGSLRGPIGMVLTRPDDPRGFGVFVASKGKVSLFLDKNLDDVSDEEIVVARGWKEIEQSVDAVGLAMAPDGSLYFGLGTTNYANAYLLDNSGKSEYDLQSERGTIQRISSDLKTRETICTGVRFPIGIALHPNGDLFCTDQEGATWLPNGNPFDELLHIERGGKHYGFPPRHPKHNPNVLDEPSVFDFGPQHQSTCGLHFNPESNLPNRFGPEAWGGNAFVSGESRGKLWRVQLVKTDVGYVAQSQLIACLQQLTIDSCVSPRGELVVACHSGPPDWGTGPAGMGSLYKIRTVAKGSAEQIPRPVLSWRSGANELSIAFDAPIDPIRWTELSKQIRVEGGEYVRAGDRFENLIPPYAVVQSQLLTRRKQLPITSIGLSPDLRTLTVGFRQTAEPYYVAATIPSVESLNDDRHGIGSEKTRIAQQPEIDVDCGPFGVAAEWIGFDGKGGGGSGSSSTSWSGWLPHLDLEVARALTRGSASHDQLWRLMEGSGTLQLQTQIDLRGIYRPKIQPGAKIDYEWPEEKVSLMLDGTFEEGTLFLDPGFEREFASSGDQTRKKELRFEFTPVAGTGPLTPCKVVLKKGASTAGASTVGLQVSVATQESPRPRALPLNRFVLPYVQADVKIDPRELGEQQVLHGASVASVPGLDVPELEGGNWGRGRSLFLSDAVGCIKCHTEPGSGESPKIGPDLSNLTSRDYRSNLRDIQQPSYAMNPEYLGYQVRLMDGTVMTGVLRDRGDKYLLGDSQGKSVEVPRADIEEMVPSKVSVMPVGLLEKLSPEEVRDLMTYLMKPPPSMPLSGPIPAPAKRTREEVARVLEGSQPLPESLKPLRIVLVAGPKDHGPSEHDYPAWLMQWGQLLTAADQVGVEVAWEFPDQEQIDRADVLVFFQKGDWDSRRAQAMDRFFARGGGAVYLHWAVNGNDRVGEFSKRIGLASWGGKIGFRHGPLALKITDSKHPIMRNVPTLDLLDESYWLLEGETSRIGLLATSEEEGKDAPQMWTYEPRGDADGGRVFVSIPGHYSWTFDDPIFRIVVLRGLAWVSREPIDRFNALVPLGARIQR